MHRLIVQLRKPLDADFCEALVELLGECEVTPLTESFCVLEGFEMDNINSEFELLSAFREAYVQRSFWILAESDLEEQINKLCEIGYCYKDSSLKMSPFVLFYTSVPYTVTDLFYSPLLDELTTDDFEKIC